MTPLDVYPQLQSVFLCNIPDENAKCFLYLETFKTQLSVLKMVLTDYDVQTPEPHYSTLFRSDCSLQTLLLSNLFLPIENIQPTLIKHLTVYNLYRFHHLFLLFEHLPLVEYMKIRINSLPYSTDECDYKMSDNLLSKQLHTFDLQISYYLDENMYNYLELLILQFFTSLKNLTMDILLKNLLNGKRLEKFFRLKQFHFRIQMILPSDNLFDMSTFPTDLQIISYTNHQENTQTLLTLPNTFETFDQISSDIVNYHSNINNPIKLIKVKQIKLYDTRSYTLKFFNFIKQTFPCINTLEFFHYCYLTDDMINDDKITLDSIHSLFIHASLDYSRIKRLLLLTPNIKHLSTSYQTLLILKQDLENDINHYERLHRICQQIITLNIRSMNKGEMQSIFLNATII